MQKELNCPICEGRAEYKLTVAGRGIYGCGNCQTQFVYPMQEYHGEYVANDLHNPYYGWLTFSRQSKIIKSIVPGGRILDYGCGGGHFLTHMGYKWVKYGVDSSEEARYFVRGKWVDISVYEDISKLPESLEFDVITMFAVIEHLPNPKEVVRELSKILRVGGLFVVMTGDVMSRRAIVKGEKWHMYFTPEHLYFFSAKAVDMVMQGLGFRKAKSLYTDGGMLKIPFIDLAYSVLKGLSLFDHYYSYWVKEEVK